MNGADLIAHILKAEGIECLPCFPHSMIIDSAAKVGIRPVIVRQERHALHIADGYARVSGGHKFCCTTVQHGPGSENVAGAIAQCYSENAPVLHIPGGYPRSEQGVAPNYSAARNLQHLTKRCEMVQVAERIPQMMQNAFAMLRNGRPGPIVIEVPEDIFTEEVDAGLFDTYRPQRRSRPVADAEEIRELVDAVLNAKCPVIVAGQGIMNGDACEELRVFAELVQAPVMSTQGAKSVIPENHPLALGCGGNSRPTTVNYFLEKADLIVGLGTSFTHSNYITPIPTKGRVFAQLTNWEGDISKDYPVDIGLIGDSKATLTAMIAQAKSRLGDSSPSGRDNVISEVAAEKQKFMEKWLPLLTSDEKPISPYRVIWDLLGSVDRSKTVVTHDAGSPRDQTTAFWETTVPYSYMGWGKTTQLGTGLGLAHGAKLARPQWNSINIMGDASIGMVGMDFETGVRCRLGTLTVVLKNGVMGGYSKHHPNASQSHQIEVLGGDYADMAKSLGGHGERVEEPAELKAAIGRALVQNAQGVPALLECITSEESRMPYDLPEGL